MNPGEIDTSMIPPPFTEPPPPPGPRCGTRQYANGTTSYLECVRPLGHDAHQTADGQRFAAWEPQVATLTAQRDEALRAIDHARILVAELKKAVAELEAENA